MSWNSQYLDAVAIPRWVPRETSEQTEVSEAQASVVETEELKAAIHIKALVNNPEAKFAILVDEKFPKSDLQKAWKQLKFAWKQWQNEDMPASLYQANSGSDYPLEQIEQQSLIIIDCCNLSNQSQKLSAPKPVKDKQAWWQLLQQVHAKSQLL